MQDVARHDDALAGAAPVLYQPNGLAARDWIHAAQRLVEDKQIGLVRESLRHLDALAHALAVCTDLLACGVGEVDRREGAVRHLGGPSFIDAVQPHERGHPLEACHPLVEGVLLGTEPEAEVKARILPDRLAEHRDLALAGHELSGHELHECRLARAIGPEQAGDSRRHAQRDVVEADHLPVPFREMVGSNDRGRRHATISTPRTRRSSTRPEATTSRTIISNDTGHGVR